MKVFNKDKALRQIKLKQNKNTYIKKVSIVLSCFILIVGIMYFTFAKFEQNSEEYTLINGVVKYGGSGDITLSYVVDGVSQSVPPDKDKYLLTGATCTNADITYDSKSWKLSIENYTGKVKCNLTFEEATYNIVQKWLSSANIDKNYTTLSEVFDDTDSLSILTSNEGSCDYLKNSTEWINDVTSNENAMTYLGNNDYCADSLYFDEKWKDAIIDSTYWDKVLKPLIPKMTSNTTPSGECFASDVRLNLGDTGWYRAFDWDDTTSLYSDAYAYGKVMYIGYRFDNKIIAKKIYIKQNTNFANSHFKTFVIQGSNDGTNYSDIFTESGTGAADGYYSIFNDNSFKYYRFKLTMDGGNSTPRLYLFSLQLYGR